MSGVTGVGELRRNDLLVALGVAAVEVGAVVAAAVHHAQDHLVNPLSVVLLGLAAAALVFRRVRPVAVLAVVFCATLAFGLANHGVDPLFVALIVAFGTAVISGHRAAGVASLVAGYASFLWLGALLGLSKEPQLAAVLGLAAWLLVLYAGAEGIRIRRQRAQERAQVREADARRMVSEERLRIAREVHDILAHNISLINVQAATALHRAERNEERAYEALATIKRVSQETLVELRSLLGAMREVDEHAPRAPVPTLARLDDLVSSAAAAGVVARVSVRGSVRRLPAAVDLAAYRIVQEALTNVARHAGTGEAEVVVEYGAGDLVLQVDDHGRSRGSVVAGTGLTGMSERASALGGRLVAAPRAEGGMRVRAWLPTGPDMGGDAGAGTAPDPALASGPGRQSAPGADA